MGKGDKKSTKGKRWRGSYGNTRPRKAKAATTAAPKAKAAKKAPAKKTSKKAE